MAAFYKCEALRSVRLNEGLETLVFTEPRTPFEIWRRCGVFMGTGVERVRLPSTLKVLGGYAFSDCAALREVRVAPGCALDVAARVGPGICVVQDNE